MRRWFNRSGGIALASFLMGQWLLLHFATQPSPLIVASSAGIGIFGAALALSWAAEVAQVDIPQSLSLAFLALVAVLPEYAVDIYFAWMAGAQPHYTQYAAANMTGSNRILIGAGWSTVVLAYWCKSRRSAVVLEQVQRNEIFFLLAATVYSLVIPLKGTLSPIDSLVFVGLFLAYIVGAARSGVVEPELGGPAEYLALLPATRRRAATVALFVLSAVTIFVAAKPFAEALLAIGHSAGIDEFLLVQWVAPLASESPEFIVAILFALRLKPTAGFSTLLSSKVNQWTLLVGMLPLAFALSAGRLHSMVLDERQCHEILLTSAQSLFAVLILMDLSFSWREALVLLTLFAIQLTWPDPTVRLIFVWLYFVGAAAVIVGSPASRRSFVRMLRDYPF